MLLNRGSFCKGLSNAAGSCSHYMFIFERCLMQVF